jgi:hypothetical protein
MFDRRSLAPGAALVAALAALAVPVREAGAASSRTSAVRRISPEDEKLRLVTGLLAEMVMIGERLAACRSRAESGNAEAGGDAGRAASQLLAARALVEQRRDSGDLDLAIGLAKAEIAEARNALEACRRAAPASGTPARDARWGAAAAAPPPRAAPGSEVAETLVAQLASCVARVSRDAGQRAGRQGPQPVRLSPRASDSARIARARSDLERAKARLAEIRTLEARGDPSVEARARELIRDLTRAVGRCAGRTRPPLSRASPHPATPAPGPERPR